MITYKLDFPNKIRISEDREVVYTISKKHRGHNKKKSYWSIKMPREIALFRTALQNGYEDKTNNIAWNLNIVNGEICIVGHTVDKKELKLAKFVDSNHNEKWHGYPADYIKNSQDRPSAKVLELWNNAGIISTATMKKIKGGQPCNL